MRIGIIPGVLGMLCTTLSVHAQESDSVRNVALPEVVIAETYQQLQNKKTALTLEVADRDFLRKHFTGNFMQAMENIPGVQAMDIGSGFSKPMIRGMGFNRVAVLENGIKQEGQQWGADHGLELDAFNVDAVNVMKGPASLLYGSDAMGGVIDIAPVQVPAENMLFGDVTLLGKSVNETIGASLMLGIKRNAWYTRLRYSEQRFGDYRIPAVVCGLRSSAEFFGGLGSLCQFLLPFSDERIFVDSCCVQCFSEGGVLPWSTWSSRLVTSGRRR